MSIGLDRATTATVEDGVEGVARGDEARAGEMTTLAGVEATSRDHAAKPTPDTTIATATPRIA